MSTETREAAEDQADVLQDSVRGMKFLVLIQISSRALTFIANQAVLRYLSPSILGVAAQLELLLISALFFARESFRLAVQRQSTSSSSRAGTNGNAAGALQSAVNISHLSICLGFLLLPILSVSYYNASESLHEMAQFKTSLGLFCVSVIMELFAEPCFTLVQQRMLYKKRAQVETGAAIAKCIVTCATSYLAAQMGSDIGTLPFATGQLAYSIMIFVGYNISTASTFKETGCSAAIKYMGNRSDYLWGYFSFAQLYLSGNVYFQSIVKHILTQGDSLMLAALSTLEDQGAYALASNYGGLIARMFFQPMEENTRATIAKLMSSPAEATEKSASSATAAKIFLNDIMRLYGLISLGVVCIGSVVLPVAFEMVMGPAWSQADMHRLLADYCYYIPFLAFNGITEAFVSAVATNDQLRRQAGWMAVFSISFAGAAYAFLRVLEMGARGLVWANIINMTLRTAWSIKFIKESLQAHGSSWSIGAALPGTSTHTAGLLTLALLTRLDISPKDRMRDTIIALATAAMGGLIM